MVSGMKPKFNLSLGDKSVAVFNWINWHGQLDGKRLRFIVPLESKSILESNMDSTFTLLDQAGTEWDLKLDSIEPQYTGTNGVKVVGEVAARAQSSTPKSEPQSLDETPSTDAPEEGSTPASAEPAEIDASDKKTEKPTAFAKRPSTASIPKPKALSEASEARSDEADEEDAASEEE